MMSESTNVTTDRAPKFHEATKMAVALICMSFVPTEAFAADLISALGDAKGDAASDEAAVEATGQGGPFQSARTTFDPKFKALFLGWTRLDPAQPGMIAIPSAKPVPAAQARFTSAFGTRSDPFKATRAMHAGIDLAGPIGTSIYATADGYVGRAGVVGGYGNLIELEHGKSIQTRYGHLSAILVRPGQRVKRGDLIARMGSTGRSTGSHLHYEVRVDGAAVNPIPFMQSADYVLVAQSRGVGMQVALGGPEN
jgi:murein DD-endopeptidase MepM/ murein hydrolase activator NlpD